MGQLVEVTPDGGVRNMQVTAERLHIHVAAFREQLEQRVETFVAVRGVSPRG